LTPLEQEDISELDDNDLEVIPASLISNDEETHPLPTEVHGNEETKRLIYSLLEKHRSVFRKTVSPTPALLPPFKFEVDERDWETPKNRLPPRHADKVKQYEMQKQMEIMVTNAVVKPSDRAYYSHAFLVPKPNNKWRFVCDFKKLNEASTPNSWPIPNVKDMLTRIGDNKPKYFAKFDLTSGYHQIAIHSDSAKYTAFMTDKGIFEWLRLPMGLKGAGSHFQQMMATHVLKGLIYTICEIYIDDVIVYANSETQLLERLESVFQRFNEFNISLNPEKCEFALQSIEYVGHTIDSEGIHFSREKLDGIRAIVTPRTHKDLRSFLGLANWFRDHVHNHSTIVKPLQDMLTDYNRRRTLVWSPEGTAAFENIKRLISDCPKLFHMDDISPIHVFTDASDYGIGGYLYQLGPAGSEIPIGFISKSLDKRMSNWDTAEKEGFAIFYCLKKWDYLLRYKRFTLHTDHENLLLLKQSSNKKILRWMIALQGYDYDLMHVAGVDNVVADHFSRLCSFEHLSDSNNARICALFEFELSPEIRTILNKTHNRNCGHRGVEATLALLQKGNHQWPHMRSHVRRFIKECAACQKMSRLRIPIHAYPFTTHTYSPMERLAIDSIEGLPPDSEGNTVIIVITDCFSRFTNLYATKSTLASGAAKAMIDHIGRYGAPYQIQSDNGKQFVNDVITEILKLVGTEHCLTLAYSSEENGLVERTNKEVLRHLRNFVFDDNTIGTYSDTLPLIQRIINSSVNSSIGVTPAQIIFGNSIDLDRGFFVPHLGDHVFPITGETQIEPPTRLSTYTAKLLSAQSAIFKIARDNLHAKEDKHNINYDRARTHYPNNSFVLIEYVNKFRRGPPSKLQPFLKGPLRVVNSLGSTYTLENLITRRVKDYHVTRIHPFLFDPTTQDPLTYAIRDDHVYVVERVSNIRGDLKKLKSIQVYVHWLGYGEDSNSWEPWANLRTNSALHNYVRNHKSKDVRKLMPTAFELEEIQQAAQARPDFNSDDE
jgi:transposase InsO family protein